MAENKQKRVKTDKLLNIIICAFSLQFVRIKFNIKFTQELNLR